MAQCSSCLSTLSARALAICARTSLAPEGLGAVRFSSRLTKNSNLTTGFTFSALLCGAIVQTPNVEAQTPPKTAAPTVQAAKSPKNSASEAVPAAVGTPPKKTPRTTKPALPTPSGLSIVERDRQADALSQSMMSPFCPGRTLSACPSPKAGEWRADIRTWVGEGVNAEEIRHRLAARIPQHDLFGIPKTPLGWMLPIALVLAALALLVGLLRVLLKPRALAEIPAGTAPEGAEEIAALEARLEQELDAIDQ